MWLSTRCWTRVCRFTKFKIILRIISAFYATREKRFVAPSAILTANSRVTHLLASKYDCRCRVKSGKKQPFRNVLRPMFLFRRQQPEKAGTLLAHTCICSRVEGCCGLTWAASRKKGSVEKERDKETREFVQRNDALDFSVYSWFSSNNWKGNQFSTQYVRLRNNTPRETRTFRTVV